MLQQQAWAFLVAFFSGVAAGVIFDVYRELRKLWGLGRFGTAVGDLLTPVLIGLVAFRLLLLGNWGEMRLYVLVAVVSGLIFYLRVVSRWVRRVLNRVFRTAVWLARATVRGVVYPVKLALRLLLFPLYWLTRAGHLGIRITEYLAGFPVTALIRFYRMLAGRINPPRIE